MSALQIKQKRVPIGEQFDDARLVLDESREHLLVLARELKERGLLATHIADDFFKMVRRYKHMCEIVESGLDIAQREASRRSAHLKLGGR